MSLLEAAQQSGRVEGAMQDDSSAQHIRKRLSSRRCEKSGITISIDRWAYALSTKCRLQRQDRAVTEQNALGLPVSRWCR